MKKNENLEIILGLVLLIFLSVISIILIVKKESVNHGDFEENLADNIESGSTESLDYEKDIVQEDISGMENVIPVLTKEDKKDIQNSKIDEFYDSGIMKEYDGDDYWQLEELFYYWNDYQLDAVDDLIRLPRVRTFTKDLENTNYFYYYGDFNKEAKPDGLGLAVYSADRYYCGEWSDGKRSGKGMWLQIFPDEVGTVKNIKAVTEHSYNGEWLNDLPNGEGQEHIGYDFDILKSGNDTLIVNVIGGFKDGYYNGKLYIMTASDMEKQIDWEAKAKKGQFSYCLEEKNVLHKRAVWEKMSPEPNEDDPYYWMYPKENVKHGIDGLKK